MHNIKDLRENFDIFKKNIQKRNIKINLNDILLLDLKNRKLIQDKDKKKIYLNHKIKIYLLNQRNYQKKLKR